MASSTAPAADSSGWYARPAARHWACAPALSREASDFHALLPDYVPTPLWDCPALANQLGVGRVLIKDESARLTLSSFKVLGASWAIASVIARRSTLSPPWTVDTLRRAAFRMSSTVVTATKGNHGVAVAHMGALLGLTVRVFLPHDVPPQIVRSIRQEGAEVSATATDYDASVRMAADFAAAEGAELVQDTAWPGYEDVPAFIVEGYETILRELDPQVGALDVRPPSLIAVPVGVGSLAQAVVRHYRSHPKGRTTAVLGVEPEAAPCVLESLVAGRLQSVRTAGTSMTGLNCGTPSSIAWPYLRDGLDAAVTVSDVESARAMHDLRGLGIDAGPSGAASLAGARTALTGRASEARRAELGLDSEAVVILLNTEGSTTSAVREPRRRDG